jgi:phage-related protein
MSMSAEEKLKIIIEAQNKSQKAFDEANEQIRRTEKNYKSMSDKMDQVGKKMQSVGKGMTIGLTLPIVALGAQAAKSLIRIEQIGAQTEAALKSTGNAANTTRAKIDEMAGKLEELTGAEAESVTMGQNMLLTFTNIKNGVGEGNDIFDQATKAMLDMGTGMNGGVVPAGEQLKTTAIQLGKALNDPIKGVAALSKVGVQFTADQKEQIKTMVDAGDTMGAQKLILKELNTQFGGSAEAFGQTTAGKIEIMKHRFGTVTEELTANLLPSIIKVVEKVSTLMQNFSKLSEGQKKFIFIAAGVAAALGPVVYVMGALVKTTKGVYSAGKFAVSTTKSLVGWTIKHGKATAANLKFQAQYRAMQAKENALKVAAKAKTVALMVAEKARMAATKVATAIQAAFNAVMAMNPIFLIVAAVVALIAVMVLLYKKNKTVRDFIDKAWKSISSVFISAFNSIKGVVLGVIDWIKNNWQLLLGIILGPIALIVVGFVKYRDQITAVFKAIWGAIKWAWDGIVTVIKWAWENVIKPIWDVIVGYVTNILIPGYKLLWSAIQTVWNGIITVIKWAWENVIKPIWDLIKGYITNVLIPIWTKVWEAVQGAWNFMKPIFEAIWAYIRDTLIPVFQRIWDKVKDVFTKAWNKVVDFKNGIVGAFNTVKSGIQLLIDKFNGIKDKVSSAFKSVAGAITSPFKSAFNGVADIWNKSVGKLKFTIPDWVPGVGGKKFSMPKIDKLYKGVRNFAGGTAIVGDVRGQGGEIVHMPSGTDVYNNKESKRILRSLADGTGTQQSQASVFNMYGNITISSAEAADRFFERLNKMSEMQSMGVPV